MEDVPRSEQFNDVYFSREGGMEETRHVFLEGNNLPEAWAGKDRFTIAETGFGTGLNFLLAWELFERSAPKDAFLDFISVEKYPMRADAIRQGLSPFAKRLEPYLDKMLARYPILAPGFHRIVFDGRVALTLIFGDANDVLPDVSASVDAWFLDGFTPSKNPDMWSETVFSQMARLSHAGTSFATFTAAGFVKRGLQTAGFAVEKKRGFGSKRDMLAGRYASDAGSPLDPPVSGGKVHILGAGLAGCAAAYVLKQYGFTPVLHDPNGIAGGASGNPVGLINPRFTAFRSAESDFYASGFAQTVRSFADLAGIDYAPCGTLHLITGEDKEKRFTRTLENWEWDHAHMQLLDAGAASEIAGIQLNHAALYLPDAAQVSPRKLCEFYADGVEFHQETFMPQEDDVVIFANGAGVLEFYDLPIHTVRGQVTFAPATKATQAIKANICYGGYLSAASGGVHCVGSTFQKWLSHTDVLPEDDADNLQKLCDAVPDAGTLERSGSRAALRCASKDRFPVIGRMAENRYVSTAHGSHGILSTLAGAHLLADMLRCGPYSLSNSTIECLSPERFSGKKQDPKTDRD